MTESTTESVTRLLADLHAERVATWRPEVLQVNIDQRRTLVADADRDGFVKPGDLVEPFKLAGVDGTELALGELLATGPLVLVFFRFAGCPACNIALPYYHRRLYPALNNLGARLVAVSPQVPERLVEIRDRHGLSFPVATDRDNALARRFGILYTFDAASQRAALAGGRPIGEVTGTGTWELPMPTIVVIGRDRRVAFAEVSPDWLVRIEAGPVIDAVRTLVQARAAA